MSARNEVKRGKRGRKGGERDQSSRCRMWSSALLSAGLLVVRRWKVLGGLRNTVGREIASSFGGWREGDDAVRGWEICLGVGGGQKCRDRGWMGGRGDNVKRSKAQVG